MKVERGSWLGWSSFKFALLLLFQAAPLPKVIAVFVVGLAVKVAAALLAARDPQASRDVNIA
jgi:hypothetical protein